MKVNLPFSIPNNIMLQRKRHLIDPENTKNYRPCRGCTESPILKRSFVQNGEAFFLILFEVKSKALRLDFASCGTWIESLGRCLVILLNASRSGLHKQSLASQIRHCAQETRFRVLIQQKRQTPLSIQSIGYTKHRCLVVSIPASYLENLDLSLALS